MILLSGHSLTSARKVPVEAMSIQLKERDSSASLTPADMTGIQVNSWLKDEGNPGSGIVWRVKSIAQAYATQTPTVSLEHAIATLKDRILFGTHGPAQITGNSKATTCTALQAIRYILGQQSDWTLGSFPYNVANPYKFDGDTLFDALETVSDSLQDAWWSYDFSTYPFKLNITQKSSAVGSELRVNRNLRTITRTIDKSGMYTRFYPIGANDLHLDGNGYVEKNTAAYGVVSKVETDNSIETKAELQRWANERLNAHAEPTVSIDVEGFELADATGETMDRLTLGTVCRIPLPEYGTTIQERIVSLSYQDKVHQPEVVKITLSNNRTDITRIIADNMKRGGRSSRASAKREKEDMAWFEDTNDHVAMCAKGIVGVDAQGNPNWIRLSQIIVDENGIASTVASVQNGLVIANTAIKQNENAITLEANRAKGAEGSLSSRLTITANAITQEVTRATSAEGTLSGRITTESDRISLVVEGTGENAKIKPASIVASINGSSSSILISADKIRLDGNTTVGGMLSVEGGALNVKNNAYINGDLTLAANKEVLATNYRVGGYIRFPGSSMGSDVYISRSDVVNMIISASVENNVLTLTPKTGDPITFSKATTLTGAWSSGVYTVTASPQGNHISTAINMDPNGGGWSNGTFTRNVVYNNGQNYYPTGITAYAYIYKSNINLTRGSVTPTEPSADATLLKITANGWYVLSISVHGITKTYKLQIAAS